MCLWFPSWCCACELIVEFWTFIALFFVDEPVFDEVNMLTSWTLLRSILL